MIDFNRPPIVGTEQKYFQEALESGKLCGDGNFTKRASAWLENKFHVRYCYLTTSCTAALEMGSWLCSLEPGDEVIMPSYTFVSTADAFVLRGAKIVYVDIDPKTMNMNADLIEEAITDRTRAIVPVHYAGVACDMDKIMAIAKKHNLKVVEDAAQGVNAYYRERHSGRSGIMAATAFMRQRIIPWEKAERLYSTMRKTANVRRLSGRREQTGASFSAGRLTSTHGWTMALRICRLS